MLRALDVQALYGSHLPFFVHSVCTLPFQAVICQTAFTDLNLYGIKGALAFVCFSFFGYVCKIKLNTQLSSPR